MEKRNERRGFLKDRKWQLLCLVLAVVLIISIGFNIYQSFNASANSDDSEWNPLPYGGAGWQTNSTFTWLNFTFTWGSDAQKIVQGEFSLKVSIGFYIHYYSVYGAVAKGMLILIEANDDDYNEWDYIGLVFDTNQNGYIDSHDSPIALYANNMTQPAVLYTDGFLGFAEMLPIRSPHHVEFNSGRGYAFSFHFPSGEYGYLKEKSGNPLHICYFDEAASRQGSVYVRFQFYIPVEL